MATPVRHHGKWRIRWVDENGKRRSEVYDERRDAILKLREHELHVQEIKRGLRRPVAEDKTFDDLCTYWIEKRAILKRSRKDDESIIRRHLRPAFGGVKLRDLGIERIDAFTASKANLDKKTVHNFLTLLGSMLRTALDFDAAAPSQAARAPL